MASKHVILQKIADILRKTEQQKELLRELKALRRADVQRPSVQAKIRKLESMIEKREKLMRELAARVELGAD